MDGLNRNCPILSLKAESFRQKQFETNLGWSIWDRIRRVIHLICRIVIFNVKVLVSDFIYFLFFKSAVVLVCYSTLFYRQLKRIMGLDTIWNGQKEILNVKKIINHPNYTSPCNKIPNLKKRRHKHNTRSVSIYVTNNNKTLVWKRCRNYY